MIEARRHPGLIAGAVNARPAVVVDHARGSAAAVNRGRLLDTYAAEGRSCARIGCTLRIRQDCRRSRSRSALAMTDTELKLIAAAAIIGLSSTPKNG